MTICPHCGCPAEIVRRVVLESTDGLVEHVGLLCIQRHVFMGPTDFLVAAVEASA